MKARVETQVITYWKERNRDRGERGKPEWEMMRMFGKGKLKGRRNETPGSAIRPLSMIDRGSEPMRGI
jgi:hypothetical protein